MQDALTEDQLSHLTAEETDTLAADEARTIRLQSQDARARASWTPVSERWIEERVLSAERCSHPERRAYLLRLAALGAVRHDLVTAAQRPLVGAGYGRNKYPGKCADCGVAVGERGGWFRRVSGRTVVRCHGCAWAQANPA